MSKAPVYHDPVREPHYVPVQGIISLREAPSSYSSWFILVDMNMRETSRNRVQYMIYDVPSTLQQYILVFNPTQDKPMIVAPMPFADNAPYVQVVLNALYNIRSTKLEQIVANARSTRDK